MSTTSKSRRLRFSVRTLLIAVTIFCVWLGWQVSIVRERQSLRESMSARSYGIRVFRSILLIVEARMNARRMLGFLGVTIASIAVVSSLRPVVWAAPDRALLQKASELQNERLAEAKDYQEATRAAYENGVLTLAEVVNASKELLDAELAVATNQQRRLRAYQSYVDREKDMNEKVEALFSTGSKGGEKEKYHLTRLSLVKARLLLSQEQAEGE